MLETYVSAPHLFEHMTMGCLPAEEIAAVRVPNPSLNSKAFTREEGRTDAVKLQKLYNGGYTIRIGNLQRVLPSVARISQGIQTETGYSNYVHAFLTPSGNQGLKHHWDQQMAVIVQLSGAKRWDLWRPPVEAPMRSYNESFRVWRPEFIPTWEAEGPDLRIDLEAGQSLLLPRGWVHNAYVPEGFEASVHLTFAIRERTPLWLMEKLTAGLIEDPEFRRIVLPGQLGTAALAEQLRGARDALITYLESLDTDALMAAVQAASRTELEYTT
ncbi:JmjC domain-containing protein [Streptomyces sp. NPDC094448]|uniref:JmjC domain-containing protein n=1 Tax=Streptomyces sp. NPDC094448 TaxID=3366063 RepID=UPI0038072754